MTSNRRKLLAMVAFALLPSGLAAQDTVRTLRSSRRDSAVVSIFSAWEAKRNVEQDTSRIMPDSLRSAHAFEQYLFPPELIMQHQARLKLTEAQRNVIVAEISKLQATAIQAQWRVGDESEKLAELLQREPVAEAAALAQAERMIMYETSVKRAQLSMLIRIRNVLTPEQRQILQFRRRLYRE